MIRDYRKRDAENDVKVIVLSNLKLVDDEIDD